MRPSLRFAVAVAALDHWSDCRTHRCPGATDVHVETPRGSCYFVDMPAEVPLVAKHDELAPTGARQRRPSARAGISRIPAFLLLNWTEQPSDLTATGSHSLS